MTYKLFVGGLSIQMKEKDIKNYFSQFGPIRSVKVIRNDNRVSKCYSFMWMDCEDTMNRILSQKPHTIGNRIVDVNYVIDAKKEAVQRINDLKMKKLFVGGLSKLTTTDSLKLYFESFGQVRSCFVICRPDSKVSRRFGYVEFLDPEVAEEVLRNKTLYLEGKDISCRRFGEKDTQSFERDSATACIQKHASLENTSLDATSPREATKAAPNRQNRNKGQYYTIQISKTTSIVVNSLMHEQASYKFNVRR